VQTLSRMSLQPDRSKALADSFDQLQRPWLRMWLSHEYRDRSGSLQRVPLGPEDASKGHEVQAVIENDQLAWRLNVVLRLEQGVFEEGGNIVAYFEEIDRRMPAEYPQQEPIGLETLFEPTTFVDSGPRFSACIPLLEMKSA
jgi:hypothetical protein